MRGIISASIQAKLCAERIANSYRGAGVAGGVHWGETLAQYKQLQRTGEYRAAGIIDAIHQGAVWFGQRLADCALCRPESSYAKCAWCSIHRGLDELDTPLHSLWTCPRHELDGREAVAKTQHLAPRATAEAASNPAYWFRGLLPDVAVRSVLDGWAPQSFIELVEPDELDDEIYVLPPGAIAATDGSGGQFPTDSLLRRVGFGIVIAAPMDGSGDRDDALSFAPTAKYIGGVDGPQTVPRAELAAVAELLQWTAGDILILSDSAYVVGHVQRGFGVRCSTNCDLWADIRRRLKERPGLVTIHKVKSHTSPEAVQQGVIKAADRHLNGIADTLAGIAARKAALPPGVVKDALEMRAELRLIQSRHLAVCGDLFASRRSAAEKLAARHDVHHEPRRQKPPLHERLAAAAEKSAHEVRWLRWQQRVVCTACKRRSRPEDGSKWLARPCPAEGVGRSSLGGRIHSTHRIFRAGEITACSRCVCYSVQRLSKLQHPCKGQLAPPGWRYRLKRLRAGLLPQGTGSPEQLCGLPPQPARDRGQLLTAAERLAALRMRVRARAVVA